MSNTDLLHKQVQALLTDFVAEELTTTEQQLVEQHLPLCQQCQEEVAEIRHIRQMLRSLKLPSIQSLPQNSDQPFSLVDAVMNHLSNSAPELDNHLIFSDENYLDEDIDNDPFLIISGENNSEEFTNLLQQKHHLNGHQIPYAIEEQVGTEKPSIEEISPSDAVEAEMTHQDIYVPDEEKVVDEKIRSIDEVPGTEYEVTAEEVPAQAENFSVEALSTPENELSDQNTVPVEAETLTETELQNPEETSATKTEDHTAVEVVPLQEDAVVDNNAIIAQDEQNDENGADQYVSSPVEVTDESAEVTEAEDVNPLEEEIADADQLIEEDEAATSLITADEADLTDAIEEDFVDGDTSMETQEIEYAPDTQEDLRNIDHRGETTEANVAGDTETSGEHDTGATTEEIESSENTLDDHEILTTTEDFEHAGPTSEFQTGHDTLAESSNSAVPVVVGEDDLPQLTHEELETQVSLRTLEQRDETQVSLRTLEQEDETQVSLRTLEQNEHPTLVDQGQTQSWSHDEDAVKDEHATVAINEAQTQGNPSTEPVVEQEQHTFELELPPLNMPVAINEEEAHSINPVNHLHQESVPEQQNISVYRGKQGRKQRKKSKQPEGPAVEGPIQIHKFPRKRPSKRSSWVLSLLIAMIILTLMIGTLLVTLNVLQNIPGPAQQPTSVPTSTQVQQAKTPTTTAAPSPTKVPPVNSEGTQAKPSAETCPETGKVRPAYMPDINVPQNPTLVYIFNQNAVGDQSQASTLRTYDVVTKAKQDILYLPDQEIKNAQLSPDGKWVSFFVRLDSQTYALKLIRIDGTQLQTLYCQSGTNSSTLFSQISWSPEQQYLAFGESSSAPGIQLYALDIENGNLYLPLHDENNGLPGTYLPLRWKSSTDLYITYELKGIGGLSRARTSLNEIRDIRSDAVDNVVNHTFPANTANNAACLDFDVDPKTATLLYSSCQIKNDSTTSPNSGYSGPGTITSQPLAGGDPKELFKDENNAITYARYDDSTILFVIDSNPNTEKDTSKNGLWRLNADGTTTQLATAANGEHFRLDSHTTPASWQNKSRDGKYYAALEYIDAEKSSQSLVMVSTTTNTPAQTIANTENNFGNIVLLGWTGPQQ